MSQMPQGPGGPPSGQGQPQQGAPQGQPQPQQQPLPIPFGKADELRLSRLQNALSAAQQKVDSGEWFPHEGQQMQGMILQQMQPLLQKQQQAQQQQMQQQQQQMLQQAAQMEAIRQVHLNARAQQFQQTVASFTDPSSGVTTHFYPDEKGNYHEVEAKHHHAEQDRMHEMAMEREKAMQAMLQSPPQAEGPSSAST